MTKLKLMLIFIQNESYAKRLLLFERGSPYIAQAGLELKVLLSPASLVLGL